MLQKAKDEDAAEAEWLSNLRNIDSKQTIFGSISKVHGDEHPHIKYIKNKISKLIKQELEFI